MYRLIAVQIRYLFCLRHNANHHLSAVMLHRLPRDLYVYVVEKFCTFPGDIITVVIGSLAGMIKSGDDHVAPGPR
jgi:hypothetical protein